LLVQPVELISLIMSRRMLHGVKEHAERALVPTAAGDRTQPGASAAIAITPTSRVVLASSLLAPSRPCLAEELRAFVVERSSSMKGVGGHDE
jgi:hypothetical protein